MEDFIERNGLPVLQLLQGIGRHSVESAGLNGSFEFLINHSGSPCLEQARQVERLPFGELLGEIHDFGGAHLEIRNHRMGVMTNIPGGRVFCCGALIAGDAEGAEVPEPARWRVWLGSNWVAKTRGNGRPARFPTDHTGGTPVPPAQTRSRLARRVRRNASYWGGKWHGGG